MAVYGVGNIMEQLEALLHTAGTPVASAQQLVEETCTYRKAAADGADATATSDEYFFHALRAIEVLDVQVIPIGGTLTAHADNFATIIIQKEDGATGGMTVVASETTEITGSGDWAVGTLVPLTLSTVAGAVNLDAGDVLAFEITKDGTGVTVPISHVVVTYRQS